LSFEAYWSQLRQQDDIRSSEELLKKVSSRLDIGTQKHSKRTAIGVALVSYVASIEHDITVPLVAAALAHDLGKHACQDIIMAPYVDFSHPYNKYLQRRHPHDGFVIVRHHMHGSAHADVVGAHVLTHHTHKRHKSANYPTPQIIETYTDIGDVSETAVATAKQTGPLLAHNDLIDAMTHPQERPYMAHDETLMSMSYPELVNNAVRVAQRDLVPMPFGIAPQHVGALLIEHHDVVTAYSEQ
jgi:hypothetical protein